MPEEPITCFGTSTPTTCPLGRREGLEFESVASCEWFKPCLCNEASINIQKNGFRQLLGWWTRGEAGGTVLPVSMGALCPSTRRFLVLCLGNAVSKTFLWIPWGTLQINGTWGGSGNLWSIHTLFSSLLCGWIWFIGDIDTSLVLWMPEKQASLSDSHSPLGLLLVFVFLCSYRELTSNTLLAWGAEAADPTSLKCSQIAGVLVKEFSSVALPTLPVSCLHQP